jgi:hypothetical protein
VQVPIVAAAPPVPVGNGAARGAEGAKKASAAPPVPVSNAGAGGSAERAKAGEEEEDPRAAAAAAEDALEESAIKEVLDEWKPREGHDADDEQRFRKFKHGERMDVVRGKKQSPHQLQPHPLKRLITPVRGVRPSEQKRYGYIAGAAAVGRSQPPVTVFKCHDGRGGDLPLTVINNDFCDCSDGSDEPGTSACSDGLTEDKSGGHGVFYCGWDRGGDTEARNDGLDKIIFPSRVNDGVCDCCNGADEFLQVGGLQCTNTCRDALRERDASKRLFNKGKVVRTNRYAGKSRDVVQYGKDGAYFPLSQRCFKTNYGNYVYNICPFHSVKQTERGRGRAVELGKGKGRWTNPHLLVMSQGTYCAGHGARKTEFQMECGVADAVKAVEEFETCVYRVVMTTPAACF